MSFWTEEREALVRKHHAEGLSAAQSAERLGAVSRHAVIGKRWRMGLAVPRSEISRKRRESGDARRASKRKPQAPRSVHYVHSQPKARKMRPNVALQALAEQSRKLTLLQIKFRGECKWATHEDGEHLFCGHPTESNGPYCPAHAAFAFGSANPRSIPNNVTPATACDLRDATNRDRIAA